MHLYLVVLICYVFIEYQLQLLAFNLMNHSVKELQKNKEN